MLPYLPKFASLIPHHDCITMYTRFAEACQILGTMQSFIILLYHGITVPQVPSSLLYRFRGVYTSGKLSGKSGAGKSTLICSGYALKCIFFPVSVISSTSSLVSKFSAPSCPTCASSLICAGLPLAVTATTPVAWVQSKSTAASSIC